jgi:amidase
MPWSSAITTPFRRAGNNNSSKPGGRDPTASRHARTAAPGLCFAALLGIQLPGCATHAGQPDTAAATDRRSTNAETISAGESNGADVHARLSAGESSIADIRARLSSPDGTSRVHDLVDQYLARISAIDAKGPTLHSVIEVNPDATTIADRLDRSAARRGPLFGVPILIKDNIDTADRMLTTAGSLALVDSKPAHDAFIVTRLRESGAVLLGKTNLSEWANFRSNRSSSGWSGRGGQTRNPYALDRNPCGSSSGSGAAIAAGLAVVAVGTETDGSIVCPSSANGLVGIKPTVGLVSRSGIIPISASQDTAGPMARTVADAAALLTVLAGYDPQDPATAPLKDRPPVDYTHFLNANSLEGVRIGVMRHYAGFHEKVDVVFESALAALRTHGAVLVDPVEVPNSTKLDADEQTLLQFEFKDGLNRYLKTRVGSGPRTLAELIRYNDQHTPTEMPYFGQELLTQSNDRGDLSDSHYIEAHERARSLAGPQGIDAALAKDHLDVLVAPTMGPAWTTDLVNGDHFLGGGVSTLPAVAGYPHVTVPMGAVEGLPVGLSFVGAAWSEGKLISYAYAFERATHARRPPEYRIAIP